MNSCVSMLKLLPKPWTSKSNETIRNQEVCRHENEKKLSRVSNTQMQNFHNFFFLKLHKNPERSRTGEE